MNKKNFARAEVCRLAGGRSSDDTSLHGVNRVVDPIIFYAVFQIFGQHLCYGRYLKFQDFIEGIDDAHTGWGDVIAPLTLFPHRNRLFSAAAVISYRRDDLGTSHLQHMTQFLQQVGIAHVVLTARQLEQRYLQSLEFKSVLKRILFHGAAPVTLDDDEEFHSEPRPIYPPRRLSAWD